MNIRKAVEELLLAITKYLRANLERQPRNRNRRQDRCLIFNVVK